MSVKRWLKIYILSLLIFISTIGVINFIIDPHWSFLHKNRLNQMQEPFNERQQKTNMVYFGGLDRYDGVIFGSSRTTFINQNDFYNMSLYNYALDSIYPFEYKDYLNFAKESHGRDFKYIVIGADFYNTKEPIDIKFREPLYYINNSKTLLYRYKMLLSLDTLYKSIKNIASTISKKPLPIYYNRENIKFRPKVSEEERAYAYKQHLKIHIDGFIGSNYKKNRKYIEILKSLKKSNSNSQFIIFTPPISANLLVSMIREGDKLDEFEGWLRDMVNIFGEVHHFMTINSITKNLKNYPDDDHFYPYIGKLLANKISKKENPNTPNDFGILLTKDNINNYLKSFEKELKKFKIKD